MITIEIELLTGRYVATSYNDRARAEWPPHPARLFSALVAAWAAQEEAESDHVGKEALECLAGAGPPEILADVDSAAARRTVVHVYVPDIGSSLIPRVHAALRDAELAAADFTAAVQRADAADAVALGRIRKRATERELGAARILAKDIQPTANATASAVIDAVRLLPSWRAKQPRTFPSVTPEHPHVTYVWRDAAPSDAHRAALGRLLELVVRLGHSSSLVSCRLNARAPDVSDGRKRLVPHDRGSIRLRTVLPGQLQRLRNAYVSHQGVQPRVLPYESQAYGIQGEASGIVASNSVFGKDWLVFREVATSDRPRLRLRLTRAADIARALRDVIMRHSDHPAPALISGYTPDRRPLQRPHLAFLSLGDVGTRLASGSVLGVALVPPRACSSQDRLNLLRAVGRWEDAENGESLKLHLGRAGILTVQRVIDDDPRRALSPRTWCGPARHWASATPVALDENPGKLASHDPETVMRASEAARAIVMRSCERIGLPAPTSVEIMRRSVLDGSPEAKRFMPFPTRQDILRRVCVHVELLFDEPVAGPIMLGAGRYVGIGLLKPVSTRGSEIAS